MVQSARGDFDFFTDSFRTNPHAQYERMRDECPVAHAAEPSDWWAVTRESDIKQMLRKYKMWTSQLGPGLAHSWGGVLVRVDPPQHTSDRRLVQQASSCRLQRLPCPVPRFHTYRRVGRSWASAGGPRSAVTPWCSTTPARLKRFRSASNHTSAL